MEVIAWFLLGTLSQSRYLPCIDSVHVLCDRVRIVLFAFRVAAELCSSGSILHPVVYFDRTLDSHTPTLKCIRRCALSVLRLLPVVHTVVPSLCSGSAVSVRIRQGFTHCALPYNLEVAL